MATLAAGGGQLCQVILTIHPLGCLATLPWVPQCSAAPKAFPLSAQ